MKSVLISVKPQPCDLIRSGSKTLEIRKVRPKVEISFKCYIYETQGKTATPWIDEDGHAIYKGSGQVIGEFICDKIIKFTYNNGGFLVNDDIATTHSAFAQTRLTDKEFRDYANEKSVYGLTIKSLKIYDNPKELSEFYLYNEELEQRFEKDEDYCCYDATNEYGEALTECDGENISQCYRCWEEWSGYCHRLTRPPQSWCYVNEVEECS